MANTMKIKRDALKDFMEEVLQAFDAQYRIEDRLRIATFQQSSRAERIAIMGEDYAYAEVLYRPRPAPEGQRSAGSTTRRRHHDFDVFIWYRYEDSDNYADSSQALWDDITEDSDGVLASVEGKSYLVGADDNQYVLSKPEQIAVHEVVVDTSTMEMAHFMNFRVTVRS